MLLLQMATYWFVIGWFDNQSTQKSEVRQAAKDIVKSEVYCYEMVLKKKTISYVFINLVENI